MPLDFSYEGTIHYSLLWYMDEGIQGHFHDDDQQSEVVVYEQKRMKYWGNKLLWKFLKWKDTPFGSIIVLNTLKYSTFIASKF